MPLATDQAAWTYLTQTRGLTISEDDKVALRWIDNCRGDESAMLVANTDNEGNLVAIQTTYITPAGQKTPLPPPRITERGPHDWARRGMVRFGIAETATLYLTEGVEDALAVRMATEEPVAATLGVSNLGKAKLPLHVKQVIVVRDGNPDGHAADIGLWRGVVRLMGQRVTVKVTQRPLRLFDKSQPLKDANDVLRAYCAEGVGELLKSAATESNEINTEIILDELSRLDITAFENARQQAGDLLGMRLGALDTACRMLRKRRSEEMASDDEEEINPDDLLWPDPVLDLGEVLDTAVKDLALYVIAEPTTHDLAVLWAFTAHLLHRTDLNIDIAPRLSVQSATPGCGKSTMLDHVACLCPRPILTSSISTAALFRVIDALRPTLFLDEADNMLKGDNRPDLMAILLSGHRRQSATVTRTEPDKDGKFPVVRFSTFTGIVFAAIGRLPEALQDRCLSCWLRRALPKEKPKQLPAGRSQVAIDCRKRFARAASDLTHFPDVELPDELGNRLGDNWRTIFRVAELIGGTWPARTLASARASLNAENDNMLVAVLEAVWTVFYEKGLEFMRTEELAAAMLALDEGRWKTVNKGKEIDAFWLATMLNPVLPKDEKLLKLRRQRRAGIKNQVRGFHVLLLQDAWKRWCDKELPTQFRELADAESDTVDTSTRARTSRKSKRKGAKSTTNGAAHDETAEAAEAADAATPAGTSRRSQAWSGGATGGAKRRPRRPANGKTAG